MTGRRQQIVFRFDLDNTLLGDVVFQPRKVKRSDIFDAVEGRGPICAYEKRELDEVNPLHPVERYILVDDKVRVLAAVRQAMGLDSNHSVCQAGARCVRPAGACDLLVRGHRGRTHRSSPVLRP
jgi:hypothetical protein